MITMTTVGEISEKTASSISNSADWQIGLLAAGSVVVGTVIGAILQFCANVLKRRIDKVEAIRLDVYELLTNLWYFTSAMKQMNFLVMNKDNQEKIDKVAGLVGESYNKTQFVLLKLMMCADIRVAKLATGLQEKITNIFEHHSETKATVTQDMIDDLDQLRDSAFHDMSLLSEVVARKTGKRMPEFRSLRAAERAVLKEREQQQGEENKNQ